MTNSIKCFECNIFDANSGSKILYPYIRFNIDIALLFDLIEGQTPISFNEHNQDGTFDLSIELSQYRKPKMIESALNFIQQLQIFTKVKIRNKTRFDLNPAILCYFGKDRDNSWGTELTIIKDEQFISDTTAITLENTYLSYYCIITDSKKTFSANKIEFRGASRDIIYNNSSFVSKDILFISIKHFKEIDADKNTQTPMIKAMNEFENGDMNLFSLPLEKHRFITKFGCNCITVINYYAQSH